MGEFNININWQLISNPSNRSGCLLIGKIFRDIPAMSLMYILLQSYRIQHAYIATQAPLDTTFHDIWRLVYDSGASTIVMLNKVDDDGVRFNVYHL